MLVSYRPLAQAGLLNRLVDLAGRDNTGSRSQTKERSQTDVGVTAKRILRLASMRSIVLLLLLVNGAGLVSQAAGHNLSL